MNNTNDDKKEKFYIGGFVSIEEAKLLLQRIVPLARIYQTRTRLRSVLCPKKQKKPECTWMDSWKSKQRASLCNF